MPNTIPDNELLTDAGLGELLRVSGRTIQRMAQRPGFPKALYVRRCRRWDNARHAACFPGRPAVAKGTPGENHCREADRESADRGHQG